MKRLVGVLTALNGWIVGSYGFNMRLPVGKITHQIEELERWQVDEIALIDLGASFERPGYESLLEAINETNPLTPILVGGGISSYADAARVLSSGADRVLLGSGAFNDFDLVRDISASYGDQAVVVAVPVLRDQSLEWWNPKSGERRPLNKLRGTIPAGWAGELLVMDMNADGGFDSFDLTVLTELLEVVPTARTIVVGGFRTPQVVEEALKSSCVSAVGFGNVLHQRELFIRLLKKDLREPIRPFLAVR